MTFRIANIAPRSLLYMQSRAVWSDTLHEPASAWLTSLIDSRQGSTGPVGVRSGDRLVGGEGFGEALGAADRVGSWA